MLMVDSEVLFRKRLVVSKQRNVNMKHILQHELATCHHDGNMRKCVKADLATKLEGIAETVFELPPCDGRNIYIMMAHIYKDYMRHNLLLLKTLHS